MGQHKKVTPPYTTQGDHGKDANSEKPIHYISVVIFNLGACSTSGCLEILSKGAPGLPRKVSILVCTNMNRKINPIEI